MLNQRDRSARSAGRLAGLTLTVASFALIAWFTLRSGPQGTQTIEPNPWGLSGDEGLQDFVANIALFVPFGTALVLAGLRARSAAIVGGSYSIAIEFIQARLLSNRDATAADVVANTVGAAVGAGLVVAWPWIVRPTLRQARLLATVSAVSGAAVFVLTAYLAQPAEPGLRYLGQYGGAPMPVLDGSSFGVITMFANGIAIPWGRVPDPTGQLSSSRITHLELRGVIKGRPSDWARLGGLHEISPLVGRQRINIEWEGHAVRLVPRARAEALFLRSPWIVLREAVVPAIGDTIQIEALTGASTSLIVTQRGLAHREHLFTAVSGWMLFVPDGLTPMRGLWAFHLLWLALLFGPACWWAARLHTIMARPPDR